MSKADVKEAQAPGKSKTITVACKLPHGLQLRIFKFEDADEPILGGGFKKVKKAEQVGETFKINGYVSTYNSRPAHDVVGGRYGFALTPHVDREFFEKWLEQNADHTAVKNGLIFAQADVASATDAGKERKDLKSGQEPLDPKKLPSVGKLKVESRVGNEDK